MSAAAWFPDEILSRNQLAFGCFPIPFPQYYNDRVTHDDEGCDFSDAAAARDEAINGAGEPVCDRNGTDILSISCTGSRSWMTTAAGAQHPDS